MEKFIKVKEIYIFAIISLLIAMCIGHADSNAIVKWGVELLREIRIGRLYYYASDLQAIGTPTNYGIFINSVVAILVLPAYVWELAGVSVCMEAYIFVFKLWLIFATCVMSLFMIRMNLKPASYILSVVTLFYGVAMGQVDLLSITFFVIGIYLYEQERNSMAFLLFSFSCLVKAFPLIAMAPIFIYLFKKQFLCNEKFIFIKEGIVFWLPISLEKLIENVFFENYSDYRQLVNELNFLPKLAEINICGMSVYVILTVAVLLVFAVLVMIGRVEKIHLVICIEVLYGLFYGLVDWSPQYLVYGFLWICITADSSVISIVTSIGVSIISIAAFNVTYINSFLISNTIIGKYLKLQDVFISNYFSDSSSAILYWIGRLIIVGVFVYEILKNCKASKTLYLDNELDC